MIKTMHIHSDNENCVRYLRNYVVLEQDDILEYVEEQTFPYADVKDDQCCVCYFSQPCPTMEVEDDDDASSSDEYLPLV